MNNRRPHFRGRRPVTATPPPWTQPVAPPTPQLDGEQAQLGLRSRARAVAEAIVRASVTGWYSPAQGELVHHVAKALEHADGEIHVQPPPITGLGDNLRTEKEAFRRIEKVGAELTDLRVPVDGASWPVFVVLGRTVGPAGYGETGVLDLTLRVAPRVREWFERKVQ